MDEWYIETLHTELAQRLRIDRVICRCHTGLQDLLIFENERFGRVLVLDGVLQTTEADEFSYHEMLVHPPFMAHGMVKRVLIIGGGDGGTARRCLEYSGLEHATLVEIDPKVADFCRLYLPEICGQAFEDPRLSLLVADGAHFVGTTNERFDVIIVDSTDPQGPGLTLYSGEFYRQCHRCLKEGGVLVTQNGVPFVQPGEARSNYRNLRTWFADVTLYTSTVPSYVGGHMSFGWASDDPGLRRAEPGTVAARWRELGLKTRYYSPEIHAAAFVLPAYIEEILTMEK